MHFDPNLIKIRRDVRKLSGFEDVKIAFYERRNFEYLVNIDDIVP